MARLTSLFVALVLVACGGKRKEADQRQEEASGGAIAVTAAQAVVERKGLLTLSEQVADAEAPEKLKAIAPAVAVGR